MIGSPVSGVLMTSSGSTKATLRPWSISHPVRGATMMRSGMTIAGEISLESFARAVAVIKAEASPIERGSKPADIPVQQRLGDEDLTLMAVAVFKINDDATHAGNAALLGGRAAAAEPP